MQRTATPCTSVRFRSQPPTSMQVKVFNPNLKHKPLISILVVTYNHECFIETLLNSVFKQDIISNCELIISDDFSTDKTVSTLKQKLLKTPCYTKLLEQTQNIGPLENWNNAFSHTSGKFVAWLDGDDYWISEKKLSNDLRILDCSSKNNLIFGPAKTEKNTLLVGERNNYRKWKSQDVNFSWVLNKGGGFFPSSSCFFRREIVSNTPSWFFNTHVTTDFPLALAAVLNNGKILFNKNIDCVYRIHSKSLTHSKHSSIDTVKINKDKLFSNLNFYKNLYESSFIDDRDYKNIQDKEKYIYYAKVLDRRFSLLYLKESFNTLSLKRIIKLLLRLAFRALKNSHE